MRTRGVSPVVGYAILLGIVAVLGLSLLVVGSAVVGDVTQEAEHRQAEDSMAEFADAARSVGEGSASSEDVAFSGDERGTIWVEEDAGHVEVVIVNGTEETNVTDVDIGAYRQELGDGTELAYQGGGVFRAEDDGVAVVEPPAFDYRKEPVPTLDFPNVIVSGDHVDSGAVEGQLSLEETQERTLDVENPVTGDYAYVQIDSRYCEGWEEHVQQRTDGLVEESCDVAGSHTNASELRVNLSVPENYLNESVDTSRTPGIGGSNDTTTNGTYGFFAEDSVSVSQAGGTINGSVGAGDSVDFDGSASFDQDGERVGNVSHEREPHDDRIQELLNDTDPSSSERFCTNLVPVAWADCEYDPGTYRISDFNGGGGNVTFNVTDGDVVLVVPGDAYTDGTTKWHVEGHEEGGAVKVYVQGDLIFDGSTQMGTPPGPGPDGMDDPVNDPPDDPSAEALQFLGSSDTDIALGGSDLALEGTISAPSSGTNATSRAFSTSSAYFEFVGALHAGSIELTSGTWNIHMDDNVSTKASNGDGTRRPPSSSTSTTRELAYADTDLYYLHVSETKVSVED